MNGEDTDLGTKSIEKLIAAMDETFQEPVREVDKKFLMSVDQAINISGRGCVVTGTIEQGKAKLNQDVHLIGIKRKHTPTTITGIETFHK